MRKSSLVCGIAVCLPLVILAVAVAGCSSSAPTTSSETPNQPNPSTKTPPAATSRHRTAAPVAGGAAGASSGPPRADAIRKILDYGFAAAPAERSAVSAAAVGFFAALASHNYATVCAGLGAGMRAQLQGFLKLKHVQGNGCSGVLEKLLVSPRISATAGRAAKAAVSSVRIKGTTAFVLFRPAGGPRSFFVMKREKGAWKATSLVPGIPLSAR